MFMILESKLDRVGGWQQDGCHTHTGASGGCLPLSTQAASPHCSGDSTREEIC